MINQIIVLRIYILSASKQPLLLIKSLPLYEIKYSYYLYFIDDEMEH